MQRRAAYRHVNHATKFVEFRGGLDPIRIGHHDR
jgi:hypothetical protein